jgi:hypothetical protein
MDGCACACMRACACMHAFVHARAHAIVYACESIYAHKRDQCVYLCAYMHQPIHVISIHLEYVGLHYKPHAMRTYQRGFNAGRKNEKRWNDDLAIIQSQRVRLWPGHHCVQMHQESMYSLTQTWCVSICVHACIRLCTLYPLILGMYISTTCVSLVLRMYQRGRIEWLECWLFTIIVPM